jgi:hypothetical protein
MQEPSQITLEEVFTPEELLKQYPSKFTEPQLTWMLRNRKHNGLEASGAVSMRDRKFYFHKPTFANWLMPQKQV